MKNFIFLISLLLPIIAFPQTNKKPLNYSVYDSWNTIKNNRLSNNGQFTSYEITPYKGDSKLCLYDKLTKKTSYFARGKYAEFSPNSNFISFRIKPQYDSIRKLRLKKVKKNKLPKDSLAIYLMSGKIIKFANLKSFKLAKEKSDWMSFSQEMPKDTIKKGKKNKKIDKSAPKSTQFHIINPILNKNIVFKNITDNSISRNGNLIAFNKLQNDTILFSKLYVFDTQKQKLDSIFEKQGLVKKVICNNSGTQVAFLYSADTIKEKSYTLYLWDKKQNKIIKIADTLSKELPKLWTASAKGTIFFSRNDKRLFFGAALRPIATPKDTLLPEEKVKLDLWSWTDNQLQAQQLVNLKKEQNRSYLSEYLISEKKLMLLADSLLKNVSVGIKANSLYFLASSDLAYQKQSSWDAPFLRDYYRISSQTGKRELILKAKANAYLSPKGNFLLFYSPKDSAWFIKNLVTKSVNNISSKLKVPFYDEDNDYPMLPDAYGFVNWEENEKFLLIYDRYDIWKIKLDKKYTAINLTNSFGRKNSIRFHYMRINPEQEYIRTKGLLYLKGFNEKTKQEAYYTARTNKAENPHQLYGGDFRLNTWRKAKNSSTVVFTRQTFKEFPNLWISDVNMKKPEKISDTNPQQKNYLWGNVELLKWTTMNGSQEEGMLYKPENFDPNKKYPMIVYFYRLSSDNIHRHYIPKPSRSIINPTFYTSNGYLVFVPNIRYKIGYPGKSAYDYVVGGTSALLDRYSFIDRKHLAIQGQSWGGYQVAYIITQTNMFAAASAGAPVSNMTSAYGGIRWRTGMSRMFQYEKTQSRIGGTLWDKPLNYIENSPIFYVPKINTPLLIRHDDADGAVPWYQGIELFVALRRLNKPVWLLNYNGQPHNLKAGSPDCKDLSIRMMQFFDHYLKGKPAPIWMTKGIPATMKGKTLGYGAEW